MTFPFPGGSPFEAIADDGSPASVYANKLRAEYAARLKQFPHLDEMNIDRLDVPADEAALDAVLAKLRFVGWRVGYTDWSSSGTERAGAFSLRAPANFKP